jgi:hypothetical protein
MCVGQLFNRQTRLFANPCSSLGVPGNGPIVPNEDWVRITSIPKMEDVVVSIVINRWHDNVRFLFMESSTLDPSKDNADFIKGFVRPYPNFFLLLIIQICQIS